MPFVPFYEHFPKIARHETRSIVVFPRSGSDMPSGEYSFIEMFCNEKGCDCRRVFFYVVSVPGDKLQAVVAYGWESPDFYAQWLKSENYRDIAEMQGPVLNFGSPQSPNAPAVLNLVKNTLLKDPHYVERVKRHYNIFRDKIDQ